MVKLPFPRPIRVGISFFLFASLGVCLFVFAAGSFPVESRIEPVDPPVVSPAPLPALSSVKFDFDNDGMADVSRARVVITSSSSWNEVRYRDSGDGTYSDFALGNGSGILTPGDFNGDGKTDAAVFESGTWKYLTAPNPGPTPSATPQTISLGQAGDIPVAADYDGDGTTDAAVYRPSNNTWYVRQSSTTNTVSQAWGASGDIPAVGDYDDDGKSDYAVWRPSNGTWHIVKSTGGSFTNVWGVGSSDMPVPGDYNGDGQTDIAVFRRTTGVWYVKTSPGYSSWVTQSWGNYGDQPVPADYDGDGSDDYAIWRPTTGTWWIVYSGDASLHQLELGVQGDKAVPSAYLKQVGGSVPVDELAAERLKPRNATGDTDLYSQNFSWGRELVSLPGRAGMDLSLGIGYNSLVWTKAGSEIYFDLDAGNPSPGFRFGFPTIEPIYFDEDKGKYAYMMVTTSGARIQFRETAVSNTYETADSSYTQLVATGASNPNDPVQNITITVTTTDGTQAKYEWKDGAYRCTEIKDRNGNYISAAYDSNGLLTTLTDTLGRVITVNYDSGNYPTTITQTWKDTNGSGSNVTHTWATFTYANMDGGTGHPPTFGTSFSGLSPIGPPNGTELKVLQKITYADDSSTKFDYNSYAQVYRVSNIAPDGSTPALTSTEINIGSPSSPTDVPRFTSTSTTIKDFNLDVYNVAQPVTVTNTVPTTAASYSLTSGISITSSYVKVAVTGHPNDLYSRIHFGGSGWKEGLTLATEDCTDTGDTCTTRQRWTWADYTQDNTGLAYILNPRVTETQVGDGTNTKRTTISYYGTSSFSLPEYTRVYDADLSTVLKESHTTYDLSTDYTSRRIIGLPVTVEVKGRETSGLNLMSKVTYAYDEGDFSDSGLSQNISPTQHDSNYGSSFIAGRGNLTSTTRWNTESGKESNSTYAVTSSAKYNTAGAVVSRTTPWDGTNTRTVRIGYTDNFNSSPGVTTYAYPTVLTDPAGTTLGASGHTSTVKYRYDIGANVEATSPPPANQTYGKSTKRTFDDDDGRLMKNSVYVNTTEQSYVRYEYPTNGVQSKVYSTLTDTAGSTAGPDTADELLSEGWTDGAGRVLRSRVPHTFNTNGTTATWAATLAEYDILGRVKKQSVPTEVDGSWAAAGDDAARGFLWTYQKYDWKGRVVRKINTDGIDQTTYNDSDVLISYDGCGCAGGQITTIQSELVPRDDTSGNARRLQKIYEDILGRTYKTVAYQWDGTTPFTTTEEFFNGRDQVTTTRQTDNTSTATPQTYREVTMSYDGHGRLHSRHYPIEDAEAETTWVYNLDDSVEQVTNPRGVVTDITYNALGLTEEVAYTPATGIQDSPTVTFGYDDLGNRTSMDTAGVSEITYAYDSLSRLTAETVNFDDLTNDLTVGYTYDLAGLKSITDPFGKEIDYTNDKAGRLTAVTGDTFSGNTTGNYASGIQYRAFGQIKQMDYNLPDGDARVSMAYDNRLRVTHFEATEAGSTTSFVMKADYDYLADGRVAAKDDLLNDTWDRTNKFDHAGRLTYNQFGLSGVKRVYEQSVGYNGFSEIASRTTTYWANNGSFNATYVGGRKTGSPAPTYDAAGNLIFQGTADHSSQQTTTYDAAGRRVAFRDRWKVTSSVSQESETQYVFDGDGHPVIEKGGGRVVTGLDPDPMVISTHKYQVWSTVLGASLTTVNPSGNQMETKVFAGRAHIATQSTLLGGEITYTTADPVTGTISRFAAGEREEYEPLGQQIETVEPGSDPPTDYQKVLGVGRDPEWQCLPGFKDIYGEFMLMPVHCQKAALEARDFNLPMALAESDAKRVAQPPDGSAHSSPPTIPESLDSSPSHAALAYSAKATDKPSNEDYGDPYEAGDLGSVQSEPYEEWQIPDFVEASAPAETVSEQRKLPSLAKEPNSKDMARCLTATFGRGLDLQSVKSDGRSIILNFTYKRNPFTITVYGSRATSYQLGRLYARETGGSSIPQAGYTSGNQQGDTIEADIADEIPTGVAKGKYSAIGFVALIYHETGNGIGVYLNKNAKGKKIGSGWTVPSGDNDSDAGTKFERCLFGGIVSLSSGDVGNKRYFYGY